MSSKDKKARKVALRHFLVETPGVLDRAAASLGWLVVLGALALGALVLHLVFGHPDHPPVPPPGVPGDNPSGALYVRDLGRLPDGRHTFDLVYTLVVQNAAEPHLRFVSSRQRLLVGDPPPAADVVDMQPAPGANRPAAGAWRELSTSEDLRPGQPNPDIPPGYWQDIRAHYRVNGRPDQLADVAITYVLDHQHGRGWFERPPPHDVVAHDEEAQLGAVLRAHCALGVKIHNGEMRSLCGS